MVILGLSTPFRALAATPLTFSDLLVLSGGRAGRSAIQPDAIQHRIVTGAWTAPREGDTVQLGADRQASWQAMKPGADGAFDVRGGYAFGAIEMNREQVMIIEASGHSMVYVNGEPRGGDPYSTGYVRLPVFLKRGTNEFLFTTGRGRLRARLVEPESPVFFNLGDSTLPDVLQEPTRKPTDPPRLKPDRLLGAVVVVNATTNTLRSLSVIARPPGVKAKRRETMRIDDLPPVDLPPLSVRKVGFAFHPPASVGSNRELKLKLAGARESKPLIESARATLKLNVRSEREVHKRTFVSLIDGSVQYYALNPGDWCAVYLSLHGAGVEATGQAGSYGPRNLGTIVCPTNRRPYGFDWEDWGALDAMEVLNDVRARFAFDSPFVYLTGHSMGGHGTWQLGATFPDRFAAIGPSAGWASFYSYGGGRRLTNATPMQEIFQRAAASSDTLALASNYLHHGVYILHGDADDNVPVREARGMRDRLAQFHRAYEYFEQPGAGHWWDNSDEPGAACVDWPPMFDLFARHTVPRAGQIRRVQFTTVNPAISGDCHWLSIDAQETALRPSSIDLRWDPGRSGLVGTTTNVSRLRVALTPLMPRAPLMVELDGQKLTNVLAGPNDRASQALWLTKAPEGWTVSPPPPATEKRRLRGGPFKQAFKNRMLFVYGTAGTPEENTWAIAKARFDAETWWYRGNGSVDLLSDRDYAERLRARGRDVASRNVILYGNADSNSAWQSLLGSAPVQVQRNRVRAGSREFRGADLAVVFLHPSPNDAQALVGVVSGSGVIGMRVTERLPYFVSGVGFPDCAVISADSLQRGVDGVRAAGFFGSDWSAEKGEFVWAE